MRRLVTDTGPLDGLQAVRMTGRVRAWICVGVTETTVWLTPPNRTSTGASKPLPVIVTSVPPR